MDSKGFNDAKRLIKIHKDCPDCLATQAKLWYSSDSSPERKPEKRRSLLQAPKSYSSRLPAPSGSSQRTIPQPLESSVAKTQPIPIPQLSPTGQNSAPEHLEAPEFFIGDRVTISGVKPGTLLYFGNIHVATGIWCGIALDEAEGSHDGLVAGTRYFTCRNGHGIFAPIEKVSLLDGKNTQPVTQILRSPVKVSQALSKPTVCESYSSKEELHFEERSREIEESSEKDLEDEILRLDEHGIIRDSDEETNDADEEDAFEEDVVEEEKPKRRQLPKLPRPPSQILAARLQRMAKALANGSRVDESEIDDTMEKLKEIADGDDDSDLFHGEKLFSGSLEDKYESSDLPHSATGSSGNEDSWSLGKDYMTMSIDGKQYLNITFDGESESKTSTQEPSEESPSPEFIFDQEMIEDGEFSAEPMEMSRDSSLGLLSSIALEKTDLLLDLGDDGDLQTSQETLEPTSDNKLSPEQLDNLNTSVEFDNGELAASTPFNELKVTNAERNAMNLNETYTQEDLKDDVISSQVDGTVCMNATYTQDEHPKSSQLHDTGQRSNLNNTFTVDEKVIPRSVEVTSSAVRFGVIDKEPMADSGISLKGSMTESGVSMKSVHGSLVETGLKGTLMEGVVKGHMLDSGMGSSIQSSMDSVGVNSKCEGVKFGPGVPPQPMEVCRVTTDPNVGMKGMLHQEMDDRQLMSDLKDGHQRKERPISFLSTTSADTGYVPDTDSELGTLTLNSPQEWMDRGFHGNMGHTEIPPVQRNLIHELHSEKTKLPSIPVESDSDLGTMNGDTDNETDRPEVVHPVSQCEVGLAGVTMENISEMEAESEDEITQIENCKDGNKTITLDTPMNETFTDIDAEDKPADGTFTLQVSDDSQKLDTGSSNETTESLSIVTVVIADKDENEEANKPNQQKKKEKVKTPKKKKFNVVKDFKKPNTTNVVSKLSEYLKAPLPTKPKEDKVNTEEAKNKRNSMGGGKIDVSKVTSKINNKSPIEEKANEEKNNTNENKKEKEVIEKEPVKKVKRTPLKSKWDAIMSQIDSTKDQKLKPKTEVKSKLEAILKSPPPAPPKKEEQKPKPKRRISTAIPDYSKVQSKLSKYTAPPAPPKPKPDDTQADKPDKKSSTRARKDMSPSVNGRSNVNSAASSPSRGRNGLSKNNSPSRSKTQSPVRKDVSPVRGKLERGRRVSKDLAKIDRERNLSGDSVKRPEIRDKQLHIDLNDSLDGRGSKNGNGSVFNSRQSSHTDMSTTGVDDEESSVSKILSKGNLVLERASSLLSERRDSTSAVSEVSEPGSQTQESTNEEGEKKSGLLQQTNSLDSYISAGGARKGGARIVKPVARQHSAPNPPISAKHTIKPSMFTNQAPPGKTGSRRSRSKYDRSCDHIRCCFVSSPSALFNAMRY